MDEHQGKIIIEIFLNENILNVKLRSDKIISLSRKKYLILIH